MPKSNAAEKRKALDAQTKAKNYAATILAAERTLMQHLRDCGYASLLLTNDSAIYTAEGEALHQISIPFDPESDMTPAERTAENDGGADGICSTRRER